LATGGATGTGGFATGGVATGGVTTGGGSAGGTTAVGGRSGSAGRTGRGGGTASGGTTDSGGDTGSGGTTSSGGTTGDNTGGAAEASDGYPLGNPAVPSEGCGKALSTFKSGNNTTYQMSSADLDREYIVYIPSSYDGSKPYRLVFGMHCMGSSANQCANNDQFYRLKPLDTENSTIFVAPQGYTDGSPWRGRDDKDHVFFEDMVKLFESELCIDKSRIFSVGFSFGAMFTNSLAQTHQDTLRGVVVYATADYNIYFPANTGKPLAYFGVHGTADGTCPFSSGKASKDRFVKNNKCTVPGSVPEATSSTHVCYDYECPSNYPVKWCTHNGGHTDLPTDPGQSRSWDIDLTWEFITQF
jgi:poly(3-hydroxybutyrate) depolymerase